MLDLLGFQFQNLKSRREWEVESLHVDSHLPQLYVCQTSSKSNDFQGKSRNLNHIIFLHSIKPEHYVQAQQLTADVRM